MEPMIFVWLGIAIAMLIVELCTTGLTTIWFAAGSFAAMIFAILDLPIWAQFVCFIGVSAILLALTRPFVKKFANKNIPTNSEALIGSSARVTDRIDNEAGTGEAFLDGKEWTARSASDSITFEKDEYGIVKEISGVKLILEKQ